MASPGNRSEDRSQAGQPSPTVSATNLTMVAGTGQPTQLTQMPGRSDLTKVTNLQVDGANQPTQIASPSSTRATHLGETWGDFRFDRLLGKGGMGAVYLGRQLSLDRPVALKVLPPHLSGDEQFRARFQVEARAVARLSHQNVVQVYAYGSHEGHDYFAMEYVEGDDLAQKLKAGYRPTPKEAIALMIQAVRGLSAAGAQGIIHRDIKPGNMMIAKDGTLKLMDFGLAKLASEGHSLTMTGTIMGTVSYFSPEQGRGLPCDQRTDLYAIGVVLYELVCRKLPFTGADATSIIFQHIHSEPPPPRHVEPGISEELELVILTCMRKDPDLRYQKADDLLADLESIRDGAGALVARKRGGRSARRSRTPVLIAAAAAVVALAGGATAYVMLKDSAPRGDAANTTTPQTPQPANTSHASNTSNATEAAQVRTQPTPPTQPASADVARGLLADARTAMARNQADDAQRLLDRARELDATVNGLEAATAELAALRTRLSTPTPTASVDRVTPIKTALASADWSKAESLIALARASGPGPWDELDVQRRRGQASGLVGDARIALAKGQGDDAERLLLSAAGIDATLPDVAIVRAELVQWRTRRQQISEALVEIDAAINRDDLDQAQRLVAKIKAAGADGTDISQVQSRIQALLAQRAGALDKTKRDRINVLLAEGQKALADRTWDAALKIYSDAALIDGEDKRIAEGVRLARSGVERTRALASAVSTAVSGRNLQAAESALSELQIHAPGSTQTVAAVAAVSSARADAANDQRVREAANAKLSEAAKALALRIDDPAVTTAAVSAEVEAWAKADGAGRGELTDLRARLAERHLRDGVAAVMARLDTAVVAGDETAVRAVVGDREWAGALLALKRYDGLVFISRLDRSRSTAANRAEAEIAVRHALKIFPERSLRYRLELERLSESWRIVKATLIPTP